MTMIIQPRIRGFICTTAHPTGCAEHVREQIQFVRNQPRINGPKKVLVLGASTGFGLASRITSAFGAGADTIGVFFERPADNGRTATAGWYNTAAFEDAAREEGLFACSINGDAFSDEIKSQTIEMIKAHLGQVDMVIYSLASPRRTDPRTGNLYNSVLKPIGNAYSSKTVDTNASVVSEVTLDAATEEEIVNTVKVMGGEDWMLWMKELQAAGVLAEGVTTVAYSYIGPEITQSIYREGTIGRAKDHLERSAHELQHLLEELNSRAYVSVNKALVTQASSAIPVIPLYISLLYRVMKEKGLHEGCIEQMYRLFAERLYSGGELLTDERGRIRIDDLEMRADVQSAVALLWDQVSSDNLADISDIEGYRADFLKLFGFGLRGVDYNAQVEPVVELMQF
jgi:enoyl-[acyl-carrier protein] reductase/trans-2-enoyl-CoA reductase (NAD+)